MRLNASSQRQDSTRFAAGDQVVAGFNSQSYGGRLETGYRYRVMPTISITPYVAAQVQAFHTPGYSETDLAGGTQAVSYNTNNATDTRSELGARFNNIQSLGGMKLLLSARAAWAHDWVSGRATTGLFQSLPGVGFTVNGITPPRDSALTTVEAQLRLNSNWSAVARFDGQFANSAQSYAGLGSLRYTW